MAKRTLISLGIVFACLTMACLCCPTSLLSFSEPTASPTNSPIPPEQTDTLPPAATFQPTDAATFEPTATSIPELSGADNAVCLSSLEQILHESEVDSYPGPHLRNYFTLVSYTVSGDSLIDPIFSWHLPEKITADQRDLASQQKIWDFFVDIIPAGQRTNVTEFVIFTDGVDQALGAVQQTSNPHNWMLEMDIEDGRDFPVMSTTLVHEFGHLLTLNDAQIPTDFSLFNNPNDQKIYDQEAADCSTFFSYEGCSLPGSYINTFFQRFWPDIYDEWQAIDSNHTSDPNTLDQEWHDFYQSHSEQFVSGYAATSPEEDIAESFMYFIFSSKPSGEKPSEQKYLFFYDYPELVSLRAQMLSRLCGYTTEH